MCRYTVGIGSISSLLSCFAHLTLHRQFVERVWQFAPRFLSYNDVDENGSKKAAFVSSCFLFVLDLENFAFRCLRGIERHYPGYCQCHTYTTYVRMPEYVLVSTRCFASAFSLALGTWHLAALGILACFWQLILAHHSLAPLSTKPT